MLRIVAVALVLQGANAFNNNNCGMTNQGGLDPWRNISNRIVGGAEAEQNSWPWQVALRTRGNLFSNDEQFCGGTIIDSRWILTAAHCVHGLSKSKVKVVVGSHYEDSDEHTELRSNNKVNYQVEHLVKHIIVYEDYHPNIYARQNRNDIALLKLWKPIIFNSKAQPACLPKNTNMDVEGNKNCWITGWGDSKGTAQSENALQQLRVSVKSHFSCKYLSGWGASGDAIYESQICVGDGFTGACSGDSGGPLSCRVDGKYHVMGVCSFVANSCRSGGFPNVYTRVTSYLFWISYQMSTNLS